MANQQPSQYRTPVVREMTDADYREQRRRVLASLVKAKRPTAARAPRPLH
jgi:hypothetical protein